MKIKAFGGKARADKDYIPQENMLKALLAHLNDGNLALTFRIESTNDTVLELYNSLFLLTAKPVIYVLNCKESEIDEKSK
jgi:ribosome-binding ATPase YchF (GTP1/OBG family)